MDQTIDYDEYCRRVLLLRHSVKELIFKETWDVLMVESHFKDDELQNSIGTYCECFENPSLLFQYIQKESLDFIGFGFTDINEIKDKTWWTITGYIRRSASLSDHSIGIKKGDGLNKVICVDVDIDGSILNIGLCSHLDRSEYWELHPLLSKEIKWRSDWFSLVSCPSCVKLPFQVGDIIMCDARPYAAPFYCIYQGVEPEDEKIVKRDLATKSTWAYKDGDFDRRRYHHQAIRYSEDHNRLIIDGLGYCDAGCSEVPFDKMTVVDKETLAKHYVHWS